MNDIYKECPIISNSVVSLKLLSDEDAEELLKCYSDKKAVPFFNVDNCIFDFYHTTVGQMKKTIDFWKMSYNTKQFVRMTIIHNNTNAKIGTIEMFNRGMVTHYGVHGILRIDVQSRYETKEVISAILDLANRNFYKAFHVDCIATKAIESANVRTEALQSMGYSKMEGFELPDYYGRIL